MSFLRSQASAGPRLTWGKSQARVWADSALRDRPPPTPAYSTYLASSGSLCSSLAGLATPCKWAPWTHPCNWKLPSLRQLHGLFTAGLKHSLPARSFLCTPVTQHTPSLSNPGPCLLKKSTAWHIIYLHMCLWSFLVILKGKDSYLLHNHHDIIPTNNYSFMSTNIWFSYFPDSITIHLFAFHL